MLLFDTHRSALARLRLSSAPDLGAGNYFWHACRVTEDLDRPVLFRPDPDTASGIVGHSLAGLRTRIVQYADRYSALGLGPGDRIGISTASGLHGLLHHIAVTSIGAVTVLANPRLAPDVTAHYFRRTQVSAIVGDAEIVAACALAGADAAVVATVEELDGHDGEPPLGHLPERVHRHAPDDLVLISHSSGTTGVPKPTLFTHQGFFVGKRERLWTFPSRRDDRMLTALPQSHSAGLSYAGLALLLGLPTLMLDDMTGAALAHAMNLFRPTVVIGFPLSLADLPVADLSEEAREGVHTWMAMGDASHERHIRPLVRLGRSRGGAGRLAGSSYVDGLGSSEMGMVLFRITHTSASEHYGRMIGRPVGVVREAVVLDPRGNQVPVGRAGLLGVRTPSVTPGYWADPELTDNARLGGYFLTGDVVRRDEDGNFYHLDRTPDVIETADGPVYSLPVEEVVLTATGALDAAVVAADDPDHPSASCPIAVVLFKDPPPAPAGELLARCNAELDRASLARLRTLVVAADRDELPVGVTGKVLKRVLRDRHRTILTAHPPAGSVPAVP